jgi:hypothetical protein
LALAEGAEAGVSTYPALFFETGKIGASNLRGDVSIALPEGHLSVSTS